MSEIPGIVLYAGLVNDDGTVTSVLPVNIVTIPANPQWDGDDTFINYGYINNGYPLVTNAGAIDWHNVFNQLLGITSDSDAKYNAAVGKTIAFFKDSESSKDLNNRLNFSLYVMGYKYGFLGDYKRMIGQIIDINYAGGKNCMYAMKPAIYAGCNTLEELLPIFKSEVESWNLGDQYQLYLGTNCRIRPFTFWRRKSETDNTMQTYRQENGGSLNTRSLFSYGQWYTLITGKQAYGNPYTLKLKSPIELATKETVENFELSVPFDTIERNINEGSDCNYSFQSGITFTSTSFPLCSVGHSLYPFFIQMNRLDFTNFSIVVGPYDSNYVIPQTNGRKTAGRIISIIYGEYSFQFFATRSEYESKIDGILACLYLLVNPDYITTPASEWKNILGKDSSNYYSIKTAPFVPAVTLSQPTNISGGIRNISIKEYVNSGKLYPGIYTNFVNESSASAKLFGVFTQSLPNHFDYDAWIGLLSGAFPQGEINIGGGSIGGGSSGTGGGGGSFNDNSDAGTNDIGTLPSGFSGVSGKLYYLLELPWQSVDTISDLLYNNNTISAWKNLFGDFRIGDIIFGLKYFPTAISPSERLGTITVTSLAGASTEFTAYKASQYLFRNFGEITIEKYFDNYLDYAQTKITLFLPFIGNVEIPATEVMGETISLSCGIDFMSGGCTYILARTSNRPGMIGSWSANIAVDMPLNSTDYSGKVTSVINTAVSLTGGAIAAASAVVAPNPVSIGAAAAGLAGTAKGILDTQTQKVPVTKSSFTGSTGFMGQKKAFICIDRPICPMPETYQETVGYPSNISSEMKALEGYTEVSECHLENMGIATQEEVEEIDRLLKAGVIF